MHNIAAIERLAVGFFSHSLACFFFFHSPPWRIFRHILTTHLVSCSAFQDKVQRAVKLQEEVNAHRRLLAAAAAAAASTGASQPATVGELGHNRFFFFSSHFSTSFFFFAFSNV